MAAVEDPPLLLLPEQPRSKNDPQIIRPAAILVVCMPM
jgi:hypothetical protein